MFELRAVEGKGVLGHSWAAPAEAQRAAVELLVTDWVVLELLLAGLATIELVMIGTPIGQGPCLGPSSKHPWGRHGVHL